MLEDIDKYAEQEPCDDVVSRQAVLDYLKTNVDDFPDYHEAIEKVLELQSVRPQEPFGPCDLCRFNPPSSADGKPCTMCPAEKS